MARISEIDSFRGLSIVLMVFFTLLVILSNSLPDLLDHNIPDALHIGDFVLPMFLFASGMSLVFFIRKREKRKKIDQILDVVERFGKLFIIAAMLSPFSAGEIMGMDEVMLSALLFVPTVFLLRFSDKVMITIALGIMIIYLGLNQLQMLPDFSEHYLGGYAAAPFYLPIMLGGAISGRRLKELKKLILISIAISLVLLAISPPYKTSVTPSFMALSVSISLVVFTLMKKIRIGWLEYLGRKPIRYWVLMFVVFSIPLQYYAVATQGMPHLDLDWFVAMIFAILGMRLLYSISVFMDWIVRKFDAITIGQEG